KETLFHKALLIQSALLPEHVRHRPSLNDIRHYGYGIPDADRALENSERRITFTTSGSISPGQANLYSVQIPEELRRQGQDYDILIEVSLCYTAKNRRTRRRINSYLYSWLSWQSEHMRKPFEVFKQEVFKNLEAGGGVDDDDHFDQRTRISWEIDESHNGGLVKGIKRQANANQKDWAVVKSYDLREELSFAIVGHKGWEKDLEEEVPYAFVVSFEVLNGEIPLYELMAQVNVEVEQESRVTLFLKVIGFMRYYLEDIYGSCGRYNYTAQVEFISNTECYTLYGKYLVGVFVYTRDECEEFEKSIAFGP